MRQSTLRPIRVAVAVALLVLTAALLLDCQGQLPPWVSRWVLYLQLVPSLLRFLDGPGWAAAGFLMALAITLLFGRIYCATVCPLGTFQDLVAWVAWRVQRRLHPKRPRFRPGRPRERLQLAVLVGTVFAAVAGSMLPLALLDPFSLFARSLALLARPLVAAGNNLVSAGFAHWGSYAVPEVDWQWAGGGALAATAGVLALVTVMAWRQGRVFCNTLCPVGALLALVARVSIFKIRIDSGSCNLCAKCSVACRAGCIDLKSKRVDFVRCVGCLDCIPACPESGIRYFPAWTAPVPVQAATPSPARRLLLGGALAWIAGFWAPGRDSRAAQTAPKGGSALPQNRRPTTIRPVKTFPVPPPGVGTIERFNRTCTACYLCASVCPTQVIQPALLAYGAAGVLQPRLDYWTAYCTYECVRCGQVCPTGAIRPLASEAKKRVRMGQVRLIEDNCVVVTDLTACGACAEHCPTKAVRMVPYAKAPDLTLPKLDPDVCVGCGACEYACPVRPYKAIYVDGAAVQDQAHPPRERKGGPASVPAPTRQTAPEAEFPF